MMRAQLQSRPANRSLIAATWLFTVLPLLLPYHTLIGLAMGTLFTLLSNSLALYLLFSPIRAERWNGIARLVLQILTFLFGAFVLYQSGVSLDSLYHVLTHSGS